MAIALLVPLPASAMTLMDAVDKAVANAPNVASSQHNANAFKAREEVTGRANTPQVALDAGAGAQNSNLFGRGAQTQLRREAGGSLTQHLIDWHATDREVEAAQLRTQAAEMDVVAMKDRVAFETAQSYLVALRAIKLLTVAHQDLNMHRWLVAVARDRVRKGVLAEPRLTELQARLAPLEVEQMDLEAERDKALMELKALVGDPGKLEDPTQLPPMLGIPEEVTLDELLNPKLDAEHPLIIRADRLKDAADKGLESIRLGALPGVEGDLSTRYLQEAEGLSGIQWDNQAMVRLRWTPWGQDVPGQLKEAQETVAATESDRAQARRDVEVDVKQAWVQLQNARAKRRVYLDYEKTAKRSMSSGMEYFSRTTRFATDMLALADLINVRFHASANVAGSAVDVRIAEMRLLQALGRLMPTLQKAYHP